MAALVRNNNSLADQNQACQVYSVLSLVIKCFKCTPSYLCNKMALHVKLTDSEPYVVVQEIFKVRCSATTSSALQIATQILVVYQ